ncbi:MAG: hypothetical protein KF757_11835 [Phycisphaeraceae bacterium]|nr:hypothetical protein [Phycisphaeraceae bacterium]MCW5762382.1 hypothetical protein [Phycisphaeraceae bacterium]
MKQVPGPVRQNLRPLNMPPELHVQSLELPNHLSGIATPDAPAERMDDVAKG